MHDTIVADIIPNNITTKGITKKCMGIPIGEGMDNDDKINTTAENNAMFTICFSLFSIFENL